MISGISNAGPASLVAVQICAGVERSSPLSTPDLRPYHMQTTINATAVAMAGSRPAMESVRMDTPEMKA